MSFGGTALSFLLLTALLLPTAHGGPLDAPVITLGEKKSLFGEKAQANEYVSYALYYWPDPANPEGPYKPIDGKKPTAPQHGRQRQDGRFYRYGLQPGTPVRTQQGPASRFPCRGMAESLVHCSGNPHAAPPEIRPDPPRTPDGRRRRRHHRPLPHARFSGCPGGVETLRGLDKKRNGSGWTRG